MRIGLTLLIIMLAIPTVSSGFGGKSFVDGLFWNVDLDRNEHIDRNEAKVEFIQQSPWTN